MKLDPKVKNLIVFVFKWLGGLSCVLTAYIKITGEKDPLVIIGHFTTFILIWRISLFLTRRYLYQNPSITSRVARKMSIYIVSTAESTNTVELIDRLRTQFNVKIEIKHQKFGQGNDNDVIFYENFTKICQQLDGDGGIGLLVCNFDVDPRTPIIHEDIPPIEIDSILAKTVYPFAHVVSIVHGFMVKRRKGAIITMSSALGNHSAPYLSLYSATKSFMTQLTRSLHIESWGTGVAFLAVTPFDNFEMLTVQDVEVVVETSLTQIGKQYFWQICGTYASIALDWAMSYNPFAFNIMRRHMKSKMQGGDRSSFIQAHLYVTYLIAPVTSFSLALLIIKGNIGFSSFESMNYQKVFFVVGFVTFLLALWRILLSMYRRLCTRPQSLASYGKWAIVTGSTSGIGKDYAAHLARCGSSVLIISRSETKLIEQKNELLSLSPGISVEYLAFDFTQSGAIRDKFYDQLEISCKRLNADGGIGLLVNNVGMANEYPKKLEEFSFAEIDEMLTCNISSIVLMSRSIIKLMKERNKGAVLNISSGSGNHCGPLLALYSSTKIFMTQFSRSLHAECWDSGVIVQAVTPFYIVSNLFKRKSGTIIAPMPIALIKGSLAQLGKKYIWQSHGYWFHGFIGGVSNILWITVARYRKMMFENRARYDERAKKK